MSGEASNSITKDPDKDIEGEEPNESFWIELMAECQENVSNKLPSSKSILVLGDNEAGKPQLIARLQGTGEKLRKGNGLEYHFLNVRDEYSENPTKLDIWILDEDPCFHRLLKYVLNSDVISDTTVILTASMAKPWNIFYSICTWVQILEKHIKKLNIPEDVLEAQKAKVLDRYRRYVEPTQSIYGSLDEQISSDEIENNLGLDIIVVITNTDYMTTLQTEFGYVDEHFDFIQFTLRKFCLSYGAALFYVSVKEDRNCDILLKYILHRIYSFPFRIPAMFLDRDSIFVPAGWDSENKILALAESLATIAFSSPFEDVIIKPSRLNAASRFGTEVEAQNDQDFLRFIETSLRQPLEVIEPNSRDNSYSATATQRNSARRVSRSSGVRSPQKKLETKLTSGEGDTVLHTFFKSLLNRRTSAPTDKPIGMSGSRGYNPPLGSQRSSNISLDSNTPNYDSSDPLVDEVKDGSDPNSHLRKLGHSTENESLPVVDELNSGDCSLRKIPENSKISDKDSSDPFTEFIRRYKSDQVSATGESSKRNLSQSSVDEEDQDVHQLPEYFMSSQNLGFCPTDCCYQNNTPDENDITFEEMETVDRVKSKFNPPLRLLLEKSLNNPTPLKTMRNSHGECMNRASSSSSNAQLNGVSAPSSMSSRENIENESISNHTKIIVPDLIKESMSLKDESKVENSYSG